MGVLHWTDKQQHVSFCVDKQHHLSSSAVAVLNVMPEAVSWLCDAHCQLTPAI